MSPNFSMTTQLPIEKPQMKTKTRAPKQISKAEEDLPYTVRKHDSFNIMNFYSSRLVTRQQILRLLGHPDFRSMFVDENMGRRRRENDSSDSGNEGDSVTPKRRRPRGKAAFEKVPSEEGAALMRSGDFGTQNQPRETVKWKKKIAYNTMMRELGYRTTSQQRTDNLRMAQVCENGSTRMGLLIQFRS